MRHGFTTGSCSAAAAKAASYMLFTGKEKNSIEITTPAGILYKAKLEDIKLGKDEVSCAVRKDGGDDPDVTSGCLVYATVSYCQIENDSRVIIDGGKGVGRVTRKGLDQAIGNAAINSVPREMIAREVSQIMDLFDYEGGMKVIISVPDGEQIAAKTFNPRLGIEGGISIIGTTGIVEPMSSKAIVDTIKVEMRQRREEGAETIVVSPGNYGLDFMKEQYNYNLDKAVKSSNFIGDSIDIARNLGFKKMILVGHLGKLIKLSGGIMNTHSKEADSRMELMSIAAYKAGADANIIDDIMNCLTTEEAYEYIVKAHIEKEFGQYIMDRIIYYLKKRADNMQIESVVYSTDYGLIAASDGILEDSLY